MRKANEMKFGVEVECYIKKDTEDANGHPLEVGTYTRGVWNPGFPMEWQLCTDISVNNPPTAEHMGVEFKSRILVGREGLDSTKRMLDWINETGPRKADGRVNSRCGLHVHIDWPFSGAEAERIKKNLTWLFANFEDAFFAMTGSPKRLFGEAYMTNYAKKVRKDDNGACAGDLTRDRYHTLNLSNTTKYAGESKRTVEFRIFSGTTSAKKVLMYVQFCIGLMQKAESMKTCPSWNPPAVGSHRWVNKDDNYFTIQFNRLRVFLGWPMKDSVAGKRVGHIEDCPVTIKEMMAEGRRLAEKFDRKIVASGRLAEHKEAYNYAANKAREAAYARYGYNA